MKFKIALWASCLFSYSFLYADDPSASHAASHAASPSAALEEAFQVRLDEAEMEEELALHRLGRQYSDQLDLLFDRVRESVNLEVAVEVFEERRRFREEGTVDRADANLPRLRHLQSVFLDSKLKIRRERALKVLRLTGQMSQALGNLEQRLTRENRIDEALIVRGKREALTTAEKLKEFRKLASLPHRRFPEPVAVEGSWHVLKPEDFDSQVNASGEIQDDGSVFVSGESGQDEYRMDFLPTLKRITAFRLEALKDERLPNQGPGRALNGNFVLNQFRVFIQTDADDWEELAFDRAKASFSQVNWSVENTIDADLGNGWAISPQLSRNHQAVFVLAEPLHVSPGQAIRIRMVQRYHLGDLHSLGKFRISITEAEDP